MTHRETKASILVVEDEESLREALKLNLEMEGYEITTVDNGPAVLKTIRSEYFDLIILDIMLPDMDGITVCETIRMQHNDVPAGMVRKMYGPSIFGDEVFRTAGRQLEDYLKGEKLAIFAQPMIMPGTFACLAYCFKDFSNEGQ